LYSSARSLHGCDQVFTCVPYPELILIVSFFNRCADWFAVPSTSIKEANYEDQLWVWNTGEDLITAVKRTSGTVQKFLIGYRPSRLKPEML
jgi:hypothetical protein